LLLWCAATDATFARAHLGDREVLAGKCIHCNRELCLELDGAPVTHATLEHILPRTHGGTDALDNLGIACFRCNSGKGHRLDWRRADDPTLQRVISTLSARRRARMRDPLADLDLPPLGAAAPDDGSR
jgi:5-methylcytosine-specific restriction endonuclease McrA